MTESKGAPPPERKSWNKGEWEAKAKEKDQRCQEQAKAAEESIKQGRKPKFQEEDLPKPTKNLEARTEDLQLNKNLNKTQLVQTTTTGKGPRGPGFYCELCDRTLKDSLSYLDHLNSRYRQTTTTARSTLSQVRARIALLREQTSQKVTSKNYDFAQRLKAVREAEAISKASRKEDRKRKRAEKREEEEFKRTGKRRIEGGDKVSVDTSSDTKGGKGVEKADADGDDDDDMMKMMGFGGFSSKKR